KDHLAGAELGESRAGTADHRRDLQIDIAGSVVHDEGPLRPAQGQAAIDGSWVVLPAKVNRGCGYVGPQDQGSGAGINQSPVHGQGADGVTMTIEVQPPGDVDRDRAGIGNLVVGRQLNLIATQVAEAVTDNQRPVEGVDTSWLGELKNAV